MNSKTEGYKISDLFCERLKSLLTSDYSGISTGDRTTLYHPSNPQHYTLCELKRYQTVYENSKKCISSSDHRAGGT